jgi:AcrR family transcriptional regulator
MVSQAPAQTPTSSVPRTRYRRSGTTRKRILAAALLEASAVGFQKTSVARIARRADVAVGVINYHFGSKKELLRESMASLIQDFRAKFPLSLPTTSEEFFRQERAGLLTFLRYLRKNPSHARLAEEVRLHDPELYQRALDGWLRVFSTRVEAAIQEGSVAPMTPSEIRLRGFFALGAYQFLDRLVAAAPYPGDEAVADAFLAMLRNGLGSAPSDHNSPKLKAQA